MNKVPKVLILYNKLFHYRIPIWNLLAEKCDLTVTYSVGKSEHLEKCNFKVMFLPAWRIAKRFCIQKNNIRDLSKQFDVVIAYGDIAWLKFSTLPWFNKQKIIFWTLGVSASYEKEYDQNKGWDKIRSWFYKQADALVFYTDYPIKKYSLMGIPKEKMFEAPNTVAVLPARDDMKKDSLLFIGTLYRQKGIMLLLEAFKSVKADYKIPHLYIIGGGDDYEYISDWILNNDLSDDITMCGAIYDEQIKMKYFSRALACLSPSQAGLSVLESMGYGVPFITSRNAITGGEIFNIHDGVDGVVMDDNLQINSVLKDIAKNPNKYVMMGKEAKKFYDLYRTPKHMAQGLWEAISFVLKNK